jgi:hypothetical protein
MECPRVSKLVDLLSFLTECQNDILVTHLYQLGLGMSMLDISLGFKLPLIHQELTSSLYFTEC